MEKDDCVELGYIAKAHGVTGDLRCIFDVGDLVDYKRKKTLYQAKGDAPLQPIQVKSFNIQAEKQAILHFEGFDTRDAAEELIGHTLYFPIALLPSLPEGHYYFFQVIGYDVVDKKLGNIGTVKRFQDAVAQDILVILQGEKEILAPVTETFVLHADHEARVLHTDLPEGLVELYLE